MKPTIQNQIILCLLVFTLNCNTQHAVGSVLTSSKCIHLLNFGNKKTIERFFTIDFYNKKSKVGDIEISLTFDVVAQRNRISIKKLSHAKTYTHLNGVGATLGKAEVEEARDIHINRNGQIAIDVSILLVGNIDQYNHTDTQNNKTTLNKYRFHSILYFNCTNSIYAGYSIAPNTNFPLLLSGNIISGTYYSLQFNPNGLFEDRRW
jgi:hypothetical protein